MSRKRKLLPTFLALFQVLLVASVARAEDPAGAEVLFQEGRRLLADGQVGAACEKLKESFALDPMSGTMLNLAACYEKQGKTATAWARFRNAANLAKSQGKTDQVNEANRRIKALEAELSYLTIVVPEPVPGLQVQRDDMDVSPATFGVQVPVDPGHLEIVASAPSYKSVRLSVDVGAKRDKRSVTIPKLDMAEKSAAAEASETGADAAGEASTGKGDAAIKKETEPQRAERKPAPEPPPAQEPEIVTDGPGSTPWIIGGIGVAAAATGGVFGYLATQSNTDAKNLCPTRLNCSKAALDAVDRRNQQAMFADIGIGVGLAGIATATVWLLVGGPKSRDVDSASLVLRPSVATDAAVLWAIGKF
jgi:hypothetical protein